MDTISTIVIAIGIILVIAIITALPVMLLWNAVIPGIFGLAVINFWQALGLSLLCSLLFKNSSSSSK